MKYKVGDTLIITEKGTHEFHLGDIVEVIGKSKKSDYSKRYYHVEKDNEYWYVSPSECALYYRQDQIIIMLNGEKIKLKKKHLRAVKRLVGGARGQERIEEKDMSRMSRKDSHLCSDFYGLFEDIFPLTKRERGYECLE